MSKTKAALAAILTLLVLYIAGTTQASIQETNDVIESNNSFLYENCKKTNDAVDDLGLEVKDCEAEYLK